MAKKITITVPHYHENMAMCSFLFNSLDIQHGIDKNDFTVLVVNDGEECALTREDIGERSYEVKVATIPHAGLSEARNYGIDHAETEYVMFCDSDDGFLSNYGLHLILAAIEEGFDVLSSAFIEELPQDGKWRIHRRDKDKVFVHGKVYRRQFLIDNKIRFNPALHFCEDSLFNAEAFILAEKQKYIETPFYLWAWNDVSTVRVDRENICLKKYDQIILMRTLTLRMFKARGKMDEYKQGICSAIADCYCDFNEPLFTKPGNKPLVEKAEKEFKKFYREFSHDFMQCDSELIGKALLEARLRAFDNGYRVEHIDYKAWLKHIKNDVTI